MEAYEACSRCRTVTCDGLRAVTRPGQAVISVTVFDEASSCIGYSPQLASDAVAVAAGPDQASSCNLSFYSPTVAMVTLHIVLKCKKIYRSLLIIQNI